MDAINLLMTHLVEHAQLIISTLIIIAHIISALAVSKDLGNFAKRNITPQLMPSFAWLLIVLISGIWGLFIYWIMHHSSLSRS